MQPDLQSLIPDPSKAVVPLVCAWVLREDQLDVLLEHTSLAMGITAPEQDVEEGGYALLLEARTGTQTARELHLCQPGSDVDALIAKQRDRIVWRAGGPRHSLNSELQTIDLRNRDSQGLPTERNQLCGCGSGLKSKRCPHGDADPLYVHVVHLIGPEPGEWTKTLERLPLLRAAGAPVERPANTCRIVVLTQTAGGVPLLSASSDVSLTTAPEGPIDQLIQVIESTLQKRVPFFQGARRAEYIAGQ